MTERLMKLGFNLLLAVVVTYIVGKFVYPEMTGLEGLFLVWIIYISNNVHDIDKEIAG